MKEIKEIIKAFDQAQKEGKQTALATVVKVVGSSYRGPGARMLITEDGNLTGAISGGCLEGDALRKAQLVMFQKQSMLVTYDTTDDDDSKFGVGLGCNGIIHILIEPLQVEQKDHPLNLLKACLQDRNDRVLITVFDLLNKRSAQIGTCLLLDHETEMGSLSGCGNITPDLKRDAQKVFLSKKSLIQTYQENTLSAFIELIRAPVSIVIVGAGNDAVPLVDLSKILGWEITLIDGRASYATPERFPNANHILLCKADEVAGSVPWDPRTVMVMMTHNFNYELSVLKMLVPFKIPYLGILGPKKKLEKMLEAIKNEGLNLGEEDLMRIFGPIGLDIGAEAPEEIALSVVAEIKAVLEGKKGTSLRDKNGPIHSEDRPGLFSSQNHLI
jgi:xanthine/CO dehydrogenase XdhC/CoxF family maturation factor